MADISLRWQTNLLVLGRNMPWHFLMPLLVERNVVESETSWHCKRGTCGHVVRVHEHIVDPWFCNSQLLPGMGWGGPGEMGVRRSAASDLRCDFISDITADGAPLWLSRKTESRDWAHVGACVCVLRFCVWAVSIFNDACMCIFGVG